MSNMSLMDERAIDSLCEELRRILLSELEAGNRVVDIGPGMMREDAVVVVLEKPFLSSPVYDSAAVEYADVNDPHWWKAEFSCKLHGHRLACRFWP